MFYNIYFKFIVYYIYYTNKRAKNENLHISKKSSTFAPKFTSAYLTYS